MKSKTLSKKILLITAFVLGLVFGAGVKSVSAEDPASVLYVPLIGITSVPSPLILPNGGGNVTYNYAVKNFIQEVSLTNVQVVDDKCDPVKFVTGDDNHDSKLDFSETWRYTCSTKLTETTLSTTTATGFSNNISATHKAYTTVPVGSDSPAPLVSIVNTTKVVVPLPVGGENVIYTYRVNNPGAVSLSSVVVRDDKCGAMSGKLGDTNGNGMLDINEVWIYSCTINLVHTTTDTATVTAYANGLKATDSTSLTVKVDSSVKKSPPLFDISTDPLVLTSHNSNIIVWSVLSGVLIVLIVVYFLTR